MKILGSIALALFIATSLPAMSIAVPQSAAQVKAFTNNGRRPHKMKKHRGRKHHEYKSSRPVSHG